MGEHPDEGKVRPLKPGGVAHVAITVLLGLIMAAWFMYVIVYIPTKELDGVKTPMLAVSTALFAGLFGYFLAGDMNARLEWTHSPLGKMTVHATGGVGMFVFVLVIWPTLSAVGLNKEESWPVVQKDKDKAMDVSKQVHDGNRYATVDGHPEHVELRPGGFEHARFTIKRHNCAGNVLVTLLYPRSSVVRPGSSPVEHVGAWDHLFKSWNKDEIPWRIIPAGQTQVLLPVHAGLAKVGSYEIGIRAYPVRRTGVSGDDYQKMDCWQNDSIGDNSKVLTLAMIVK